jgi:hypothetical protein
VTAAVMFNKVRKACGDSNQDLIKTLDPDHSFRLEIGGES